ncbi:MAG: hypothetical protein P4M01_12390 [Acidobacteriota bacterium]|nr:hypothetical protein [Acidobacteriota bacterium]
MTVFANNFLCFDDDGRIVAASLGMAKLLGYQSRRGFLAQAPNAFALCASAPDAAEFRKRLEEPWQSEYLPLRVRCRDGAEKELLLSVRKYAFSSSDNHSQTRYEGFAEELSGANASMMHILSCERHRHEVVEALQSQAAGHPLHHAELMGNMEEILSSVAAYARLIEGSAREQPEISGLAHEILSAVERGAVLLHRGGISGGIAPSHASLSLRRM